MNTRTVEHITSGSVLTLRKQLQRLAMRSPALGKAGLLLVHAAGCLLMLAPPLVLVASAGGALYLSTNIQGPLDWFLIEVQLALGLLGAYLSAQLFALRPEQPQGVAAIEEQAPELFSMLARRAAHFKMRPVKHVLITSKAELRVVASPVLPLPILHRYSLCVGAPITFFLSRDQFRLALAGAVAATAENQSRLSGWVV